VQKIPWVLQPIFLDVVKNMHAWRLKPIVICSTIQHVFDKNVEMYAVDKVHRTLQLLGYSKILQSSQVAV
jgi:hypothetical protein